MTTFNTGNPIGSAAAKDLYDNAENLDEFVNSKDKAEHPDRLGVPRKTWHGMEQDFQSFLQSSGYQDLGDYAPGIEITSRNQVIRADGELWRLSASEDLPYITTGAGMPEGGSFVSVGDAALRQELGGAVASGQGALKVRGAVIYVETIADLQALPANTLLNNQTAMVKGYHAGTSVGGGDFYWDSAATEQEDGFLVFGSTPQGRWKRPHLTEYNIGMAGCVDSEDIDQTAELASFFAGVPDRGVAYGLGYNIRLSAVVSRTSSINFDGQGMTVHGNYGLLFTGSHEQVATITQPVSVGDRLISVTDTTNLNPGDTISLVNDEEFSLNSFRYYYKDGEMNVVEGVEGGVVRLVGPTRTSYVAGTSQQVFKLSGDTFSIKNLSVLEGDDDASARKLVLSDTVNSTLENVKAIGGTTAAIYIRRSYSFRASGVQGFNQRPADGRQYGMMIGNSENVEVANGEFYGTRHGAAVGGETFMPVPNRHVRYVRCKISSDVLHGADIHGNSVECGFEECDIVTGAYVGGKSPYLKKCKITSGGRALVRLNEFHGGHFIMDDCDFYTHDAPNQRLFNWGTVSHVTEVTEDTKISLTNARVHNPIHTLMVVHGLPAGIKADYVVDGVDYVSLQSQRIFQLDTGTGVPVDSIVLRNTKIDGLLRIATGASEVISENTYLESPAQRVPVTINFVSGGVGASGNSPFISFVHQGRMPSAQVSTVLATSAGAVSLRGFSGDDVYLALVSISSGGFGSSGTLTAYAMIKYEGYG